MPISVRWDNEEKSRIYYEFLNKWTWDEFNAVYADVYTMLDTVSHKVDAIVDLRESQLLPQNTLTEMRRLTFQQHANGGITVFITDNGLVHTLFMILTGVLRQAKKIFRIARTVDEAYAIIDSVREDFREVEKITA